MRFLAGMLTGALVVAAGTIFYISSPDTPGIGATDCGQSSNPCEIGGRNYHLLVPEGEGPFPVLLFFHGAQASGAAIVGDTRITTPALLRGYAVLAPDALDIASAGGESGPGWIFKGRRVGRDDYAFVRRVLQDARRRAPLDTRRVLTAGHSNGATFVWYLSCARLDRSLSAFAPIGGTLIRGQSRRCGRNPPRVNLLHTHGANDRIVPPDGTAREDGFPGWQSAQSSLNHLIGSAGCTAFNVHQQAGFLVQSWANCAGDIRLASATHPGGHAIPRNWTALALDWFEALP